MSNNNILLPVSWFLLALILSLTCFSLSLTASQINQVEFCCPDMFFPRVVSIAAFEVYGKYWVASGGLAVHQGGSCHSVLPTTIHDLFAVWHIFTGMHGQPLKKEKLRKNNYCVKNLSGRMYQIYVYYSEFAKDHFFTVTLTLTQHMQLILTKL